MHPVWTWEGADSVVYWFHDDRCICPQRHGYIGISSEWPKRWWRYKQLRRFAETGIAVRILFIGSRAECMALERQLRPRAGIGWNTAIGGGLAGQMKGVPKSREQRAKMSKAAKARLKRPGEQERLNAIGRKGVATRQRTRRGDGEQFDF